MPIINISSLPQPHINKISDTLLTINAQVAERCGISIKNMSSSWVYLQPQNYVDGDSVTQQQPADSHPIRAEVVVPTLLTTKQTQQLLITTAKLLAEHCQLPINNVLVYATRLESGEICENGKILAWS